MFQSYPDFLISFKVGFTFRWEPCLIWFWNIISSASNFRGIIYHSSLKIIYFSLWWATFEDFFIRFSIIKLIFRPLIICWFLFFVYYNYCFYKNITSFLSIFFSILYILSLATISLKFHFLSSLFYILNVCNFFMVFFN